MNGLIIIVLRIKNDKFLLSVLIYLGGDEWRRGDGSSAPSAGGGGGGGGGGGKYVPPSKRKPAGGDTERSGDDWRRGDGKCSCEYILLKYTFLDFTFNFFW